MKKITSLAFVSAGALIASAAHGQESRDATVQQAEPGINDIVVTASRREESAQRAAISIQAIGGETIAREGVLRPEDIPNVAPGVQIGLAGNNPTIYVRGVGNLTSNAFGEGAVAFNIDNVYVARPWQQRGAFFDLQRIEVLKGPQGTLYGRNASGGAINLVSARPRLSQRSGTIELEAGNYDLLRAAGAINLPLGTDVAVRAAGQIVHRNGYMSNGGDDDKSQAARLQLLYEPTDGLSLLLHGSYQHAGGRGAEFTAVPFKGRDPWTASTDPAILAIYAADPVPILTRPTNDIFLDVESYQLSGELTWDFGPATLTVIPAYRAGTIQSVNNSPGFPFIVAEKAAQTTVEVRLSNESDRLKWVVGGFFYDENQDPPGLPMLTARIGPIAAEQYSFMRTRSYAAFGQATFSVTDAFRVTGGLRYTEEDKRLGGFIDSYSAPNPTCPAFAPFDPAAPFPPAFCLITYPLATTRSFDNISWKAGVEYDVTPSSLLYANASSGFKSGGFFAAPPPGNTFGPEKVYAFELGSKNRLFANTLQLNVEAFYWRYLDQQLTSLKPTSTPGLIAPTVENAGKARIYGANLDIAFRPTRSSDFTLNVQYLDGKYQEFAYTAFLFLGPPKTACALGPISGGSRQVDCSGRPLIRAPKWSGSAAYRHTFDLTSGATLEPGVGVQFESSTFLSAEYLQSTRQAAYALLDADLTFHTPKRNLSVTAYIRNITDTAVMNVVFPHPVASPSPANPLSGPEGLTFAGLKAPRTFGVRIRAEF